jgi:hypothetical protein
MQGLHDDEHDERRLYAQRVRGAVWGTVIGCLIIGVLNSGLVLLDVSPFWQQVVKGALILLAVSIDRLKGGGEIHPNWWIDDPQPTAAEGVHPGAKSVNQWRVEFLGDFQQRMDRCLAPKSQPAAK